MSIKKNGSFSDLKDEYLDLEEAEAAFTASIVASSIENDKAQQQKRSSINCN